MEITDIHIQRLHIGNRKASVSITLDNALIINDISIVEGPGGLFLEMPQSKDDHCGYVVFPTSVYSWDCLQESIIEAYKTRNNFGISATLTSS
ncbi:septation protein SpoVG [Heliobacillus mobilis]|uniref:Septation protein SpoVG n=1 Tax=Heliobacterium mobile TaxID=28064 RepID=A0A6I3SM94_HELMO|nr:septation protein SpoVG family protein [Heliobacterium mobile]MTV50074.1 septation protein SpoVG [Heliobacterium mobile]